jgi:hypothetical protein
MCRMKRVCFIFAIALFVFGSSAEETNSVAPLKIGANDAEKHYGQEMIVTGRVAQVSIRPKVVLINLDKPFPDSPFTLVIFSDKTNEFGDIKTLEGKDVQARGNIKNHHDKPEIVLDGTNQLEVIEATNRPTKIP